MLVKSLAAGEMENIVARFKWQKDHGRRGPTFSDLYYKRLVSNLLCPRCSIDVENVDHVFRGCPGFSTAVPLLEDEFSEWHCRDEEK